ncbi:MAG: hypothetical protein ACRELS_09845 [Candidatus Rokuibacteriota bacterium]
MTQVRALVDALAAVAPRYGPAARKEKLRILEAVEGRPLRHAATLLRLHETLCFLQAYPDDPPLLAAVDKALAAFPARVRALTRPARARLRDSGVAEAPLDYPFGLPMARWLARRFPGDCEIAWDRFDDADRLDETLTLLASAAEGDAFSEGGIGWKAWLRVAKGGRRMSDFRLILELFAQAGMREETRDWLFESLGLPVLWTPRGPFASRTLARVPPARVFFHVDDLERRSPPVVEALSGPPPSVRRASRALAGRVLDAARVAMATRQRELHAFSYPNLDDVLVADVGRGVRIFFVGIRPGFRLPLEAYYAYLALKNGVPVAYGGGWALFDTLDFAINIFASFRQGESAFLATQLLRVYRRVFGTRTIVVDRYQLGHESAEALRSGSFYFYHRLGFRPRRPEILGVLETERARIGAEPAYRSPIPVLKRLAGDEVFLTLPGGDPEPEKRLRATDVAALVARYVSRQFGGDRRAATRESARRVARALGVRDVAAWPVEERRAFERMALVAALVPDLARWPSPDRRALLSLMRAKGGASEWEYARRLNRRTRLRRALERLAR